MYLVPSSVSNTASRSKYELIITSLKNASKSLDRFVDYAQKHVTLYVNSGIESELNFEKSSYKLQILDTLPVDTVLLTMKYKYANGNTKTFSFENPLEYSIEDPSNIQIENTFYLKHAPNSQEILLMSRSSSLSLDKPEINFNVRLGSKLASSASTNVKLMIIRKHSAMSRIDFIAPDSANYVILPDFLQTNASIIYQFQTTVKNYDSLILYRILNQNYTSLFFIDNNFLRVIYPLPGSVNKKRLNYLVWINENIIKTWVWV